MVGGHCLTPGGGDRNTGLVVPVPESVVRPNRNGTYGVSSGTRNPGSRDPDGHGTTPQRNKLSLTASRMMPDPRQGGSQGRGPHEGVLVPIERRRDHNDRGRSAISMSLLGTTRHSRRSPVRRGVVSVTSYPPVEWSGVVNTPCSGLCLFRRYHLPLFAGRGTRSQNHRVQTLPRPRVMSQVGSGCETVDPSVPVGRQTGR